MKRLVTTAVALSLALLTACGSTVPASRRFAASNGVGTNGVGNTANASNPAGNAATATGGAAVTGGEQGGGSAVTNANGGARRSSAAAAANGPITVGIVRTGVSNAAAFGVSLGNTVQEKDVDAAIVDVMNKSGGIAGRRIDAVYADTDTASANWDTNFEAACQTFTQDNHVVAVLGYVFDFAQGFEQCLAKKGIPHLSTSFNIPDTSTLSQFPLLVGLSTPRIERRSIEKIDGAIAAGVLTQGSRVGVLTDTCPGTQAAWKNSTEPYFKAKGITVASSYAADCARGSGDAGREAGQVGNVILQFRTANVDTVMFDSVSEGPPTLIFAEAAEAQGWRPKYVVSSLANAATLQGQAPDAQMANLHGFGWLPEQDVDPAHWPGRTAPQQRCADMAKAGGLQLQTAADYSFAFNICDALFAYKRAVETSGGQTAGAAVLSAIEGFGTSYVSAMNLDGRDVFGPGQHDGPALARYFAWDGGCRCFTYRSLTVPIR